jgi:hypothetical protein
MVEARCLPLIFRSLRSGLALQREGPTFPDATTTTTPRSSPGHQPLPSEVTLLIFQFCPNQQINRSHVKVI